MALSGVSIVVIAYNMPREIPRTILSLSPSMQVGVAHWRLRSPDHGQRLDAPVRRDAVHGDGRRSPR